MAAQLSGAGQCGGDDDQGTTGEAKHLVQQANEVPAEKPGISFPLRTF
jgi:hypothetical protein